MSERMNKERAREILKNDCCYECSWGCRNPIECNNTECDYRQAIITAIESLKLDERLDNGETLKQSDANVIRYNREWLYNNLDTEFGILKQVAEYKE